RSRHARPDGNPQRLASRTERRRIRPVPDRFGSEPQGSIARMSDAASAQAQQQSAATTHRADGKVENITKDEITISHGAVASLQWGPMTMGFKLPPTGLPPGIEVGRNVTFEFGKNKEGAFAIQS